MFSIMFTLFFNILAAPPQHGSIGVLDEVLFYCLPVIIAFMVLAAAAQRASDKNKTRKRTRSPKPNADHDTHTDDTSNIST